MTVYRKVGREKIRRGLVAVCQACGEQCGVNVDCLEDGVSRVEFEESDCCAQPVIWLPSSDSLKPGKAAFGG